MNETLREMRDALREDKRKFKEETIVARVFGIFLRQPTRLDPHVPHGTLQQAASEYRKAFESAVSRDVERLKGEYGYNFHKLIDMARWIAWEVRAGRSPEDRVLDDCPFCIYATQGDGYVVEISHNEYVFIVKPDLPGHEIGSVLPNMWSIVPANVLAVDKARRAEKDSREDLGHIY
jgi:hypothetical protein